MDGDERTQKWPGWASLSSTSASRHTDDPQLRTTPELMSAVSSSNLA